MFAGMDPAMMRSMFEMYNQMMRGPAPGAGAVPGAAAGAAYGGYPPFMEMFSPQPGAAPAFPAPGAATGAVPGAAPRAAAPEVDPKVKYASELAKLREIGFINDDVNAEALKATGGNINAAIERILAMLDKK